MPELTAQQRLAIAERYSWMCMMLPSVNPPSMEVAAASMADDLESFDAQVADSARRVLLDPALDDDELRRLDRIMNAKTLEEVFEANEDCQ